MYRVRFIDTLNDTAIADTLVNSLTYDKKLSESGSWSITIPLNSVIVSQINQGNYIEIYRDKVLVTEGTYQSYNKEVDNDLMTVSISGRDVVDTLFSIKRRADSYFENMPFLKALGLLFSVTDNWTIGSITTLEDLNAVVTIDLRNETNLLAQIKGLCEAIPKTFFRYGGVVSGKHTLDFGSFQEETDLTLIKPASAVTISGIDDTITGYITQVQIDESLDDIVTMVEPIGGTLIGDAGEEATVSLLYAVRDNFDIVYDTDFPVVPLNFWEYVCLNSQFPEPGGITELDFAYSNYYQLGRPTISSVSYYRALAWPVFAMPGILEKIYIYLNDINLNNDIPIDVYVVPFDVASPTCPDITTGIKIWTGTINKVNMSYSSGDFFVLDNLITDYYVEYGKSLFWLLLMPTPDTVITAGSYLHISYNANPNMLQTNLVIWQTTAATMTMADITCPPAYTFNYSVPYRIETRPISDTVYINRSTQKWSNFAPERTTIAGSTAALNAAGAALLQKAKAYLRDRSGSEIMYKIKMISRGVSPVIGAKAYISGQWSASIVDPISKVELTRIAVNFNGYYRIISASFSLEDNTESWQLEVSADSAFTAQEELITLYDKAKSADKETGERHDLLLLYDAYVSSSVDTLSEVVTTGSSSDTIMSNGDKGILVEFTPSVRPNKAINYISLGTPYGALGSGEELYVEIEEWPVVTFSSDSPVVVGNFVCKLGIKNRNWTLSDSATLYWKALWI